MLHFEPKDLPSPQVHRYLLGGVGPRPIALVSTISPDGAVNLSPFSFFNAFGANPPIVAFSPARRGRDGSLKDTYANLVATRECVVQAVTYAMVHQVSLASADYPPEVDEFVRSGLTPVPSDLVAPPRVKESPFQMECRLRHMLELGGLPGSGNLAVCEVVKFHIAEDVIRDGVIVPDLIDLVGRQSADYYVRAAGAAVFAVPKPRGRGIGVDSLPAFIRGSHLLSPSHLARLAGVEAIPDPDAAVCAVEQLAAPAPAETAGPGLEVSESAFFRFEQRGDYPAMLRAAVLLQRAGHPKAAAFIERAACAALDRGDVSFAWNALLYLGRLGRA
ncbi:MAG TPA: flavin reductase family protein [candidate division Zixibacteria bacterium]|nr:flavin reductase family protein [candidate division Zixibacteria bacterium]MDD4916200.1 flavin reductase family protein [candidate division Zixibacteria bacterium]MDM7972367.1 flavin reductase family protein [candidate division Zixibacteria bacterium]HOZ07458.1 flavin reductase family protein [candidate division Zixibacteria bacterium]HPC11551.1 flavin reductase family protein [candidate division Zixibacteria bacterium]